MVEICPLSIAPSRNDANSSPVSALKVPFCPPVSLPLDGRVSAREVHFAVRERNLEEREVKHANSRAELQGVIALRQLKGSRSGPIRCCIPWSAASRWRRPGCNGPVQIVAARRSGGGWIVALDSQLREPSVLAFACVRAVTRRLKPTRASFTMVGENDMGPAHQAVASQIRTRYCR